MRNLLLVLGIELGYFEPAALYSLQFSIKSVLNKYSFKLILITIIN